MSARNCVAPITVRLRGVPDEGRLAETSEAIARTLAGRLREADRAIAAREGWNSWHRNYARPEIRFSGAALDEDLQRRIAAAIEAGIAGALGGGPAAPRGGQRPQFLLARYPPPATAAPAAPVQRTSPSRHRRPARGWRILLAQDFYTTVGRYAEFFDDVVRDQSSDLSSLYADMTEQRRRVSLWLVQVDQTYSERDLQSELSARVTELSRPSLDQTVFWVISGNEAARKQLIQIDDSGTARQTIPDLNDNFRHVSMVRDELYYLRGARVFVAAMVLPKIRLADYLRLEPEIQLSLRYRDLSFLIDPRGFESEFQVSWAGFLGTYGERETTVHIIRMEVLRRAQWSTVDALVEQATHVRARTEDARNWSQLQPLNWLFLDEFPEVVRQAVAGYTNSATLTLSDSDRWVPWQPGWRAAILWANFQVTADQRFAINNLAIARRIADRLIAHLAAFRDRLEWWLQIRHILEESFTKFSAPAGVRTMFDLVMEELETREGGHWFNALLDILDTSDGNATRAFLEFATASTNYRTHPRILAMLGRVNANWRAALRNSYFPDTNAIWLGKDGKDDKDEARRVGKGGVVADAYSDYSEEGTAQMLVESRRAEFEKALDAEGKKLAEKIAKGRTSRDFDVTEFTNEVMKQAAQSIALTNDDFKKVTVITSARMTKVELRTDLGLQRYVITWNYVKRIDDGPWEDVPGTQHESSDFEFEQLLWGYQFGRTGKRIERAGLIIVGIGVVLIAWEAGLVAALVDLAGGTTVVLSAIALSEILTLIHKGRKFTLEDFVIAAIDGYLNALTFRFAGVGGRAIAGRIGASTFTGLVARWVTEKLFTGFVGGAAGGALTTFSHGVAGVLLGNSTFPTLRDFVHGMALGVLMGLAGEFVIGPGLQAAFRIGGQTALNTIAEAVELIRENGVSPAEYAARVGQALSSLRQRLTQFLEEKSVAELLTALRERFAALGEALEKVPGAAKRRFELALFRRIFEVADVGLSRLETDGLERLLAATKAGAARLTRDELLFFLNGLARDRSQTQRVLEGLGRLAEDRVGALVASGQLDALADSTHLLRSLVARDADLVWEVWNSPTFGFRIGDFEAWLGRISRHADDQQLFGLEVLRRPEQLVTPEGVAQALDKTGLTSDIVEGLDRLYGAFDDPAAADAIMAGVSRDNAQAYLLFLGRLRQTNADQLADQGFLQPLATALRVLAFASRAENLEIFQRIAAIHGAHPGNVRDVVQGLEEFLAREPNLTPEQQAATARQLFESTKLSDAAQLKRLLQRYQSGERLTRLLGAAEVRDADQLERLADALQRSRLPNATAGAISDEALIRLSNPAILREIEATAALQTSGQVRGLDDWLQINSPKSAHELVDAARELHEARRLAGENPGSVVRIGREARAPLRPGTTEPLPEFDISVETTAGAVQRTIEVTTVQGRVSRVGDLTQGVRHAADKVAARIREGVPIPGMHDATIEMELAVGRRAVAAGTLDILADGTVRLTTGDGRVIPRGNIFDDLVGNLSRIQDNTLLDRITLISAGGRPLAVYERTDTGWTRR